MRTLGQLLKIYWSVRRGRRGERREERGEGRGERGERGRGEGRGERGEGKNSEWKKRKYFVQGAGSEGDAIEVQCF